jgi:amidohydrolase
LTSSITELRRELHQHPEISGAETETARRILRFFEPLQPDEILTGLGGNGLAFVFKGVAPGPTVLLRCELDALPIQERSSFAHRSTLDGVSHKCGHDGHMAILAAVGEELARTRPARGKAVLLFQPAEETGEGAAGIIADEAFSTIRPDRVFALHNLPGYDLGEILIRPGTMSCASRGMIIELHGTTAHASQPHSGHDPTRAVCQLIDEINDLPSRMELTEKVAFATVVGARLGAEETFGIAPGYARILATLRSETDDTMIRMVRHCEEVVGKLASEDTLGLEISYQDVFPPTINSQSGVDVVCRAAGDARVTIPAAPFPWSEDFGRFTAIADGALFGIGAGRDTPELHGPDYDFPDSLLGPGKDLFIGILGEHLNDS